MTLSRLALRNRNPDVLECIANLSNDEVFTPPSLANQMLDSVALAWSTDNDGANIWADPNDILILALNQAYSFEKLRQD